MKIEATALPEVLVLSPQRFGDSRGFFSESFSQRAFLEAGLDFTFVQDNESLSAEVGTLRGLHYQSPPHAQAKLVRVVRGAILDVAVDVRKGSSRFGRWVSVTLSADNGKQLLVPRGFLHGFVTLQADTHVFYKADGFYAPEADGNVAWDDPDLAIDWGVRADEVHLSGKDQTAPRFADWTSPFVYEGA